MTGLGEPPRPVVGDVEMIFQANAELSIDADHRFVGEAHAGFEARPVVLHQVGPLVHVEPDAVAGAVGQTRPAIAGTETGSLDDGTGGGVH